MRQFNRILWVCMALGILGLGLSCAGTADDGTSAPAITAFTPTQTLVGNTVVITGTGLSKATALTFNGVPVTAYTVDSASQITATVPAAASTGYLTVTTPGGTATSSTSFSVIPAITSISPTRGSSGATVTLTGSGFIGTTRLTFGAQSTVAYGASFTVLSANQVAATVPSDAITGPVYLTASGSTCTGPAFTVE